MLSIVITPEQNHSELKIIPELFKEGLEILHVRKPSFNIDELRSYLDKIPDDFHSRIVIHSHAILKNEFQLKGIHYTESKRREAKEFPTDVAISSSFHTFKELRDNKIPFNYVFLSPVFNSISKIGYESSFDLDELREFLREINQKVIALGGIDENNILKLKDPGFYGFALLGAIWNDENPIEQFKRIRSNFF